MKRTVFALIISLAASLNAWSQSSNTPFSFAFITDTHLSPGSHAFEDLRACISDLNALDSLDFVIFGGDITDFGSDQEIYAAKALLDSLSLPIMWWPEITTPNGPRADATPSARSSDTSSSSSSTAAGGSSDATRGRTCEWPRHYCPARAWNGSRGLSPEFPASS